MELIYAVLFLIPTIWVGPFWLLMMIEPASERTSKWVEGNALFIGPLIAYFVTIIVDPSGMIELFSGNPADMMDTMVNLLGTESGTVLAWTHMVAGDIIATRWMWRKAIENEIGINQTRGIVFFGVMLMPVGLLLHIVLNRE
ncbi:MAG TPA: DUF4281 domain-containing protein [Candidatus Poseidoniales archaeon]|nr:MAG TPA: DUF4281 domain-containing protein [Candidatus Poseidoniales archaeon]